MVKIVFILLICFVFCTGCKKKAVPVAVFTPVSSSELKAIPVYTAINKTGIIHMDTYFYYDVHMSVGEPIKENEALILIGESDIGYIVLYGDKKGYVRKEYVLIIEADNTESSSSGAKNVVVEEQVEKRVETYIETGKINEANEEDNTGMPNAEPPETLYNTKKENKTVCAASLLGNINKQRVSQKVSSFVSDKALEKEASYYCDIFAKKNTTYSISGYSVQASGKVKGEENFEQVGKSLVKNIEGFDNEKVNKIGVAVIEDDRGYLYYVVLAK